MDREQVWGQTQEGIDRAANHADRKCPGWTNDAFNTLVDYLFHHPTETLISPQVREWASTQGLPDPPTEWAWGSIFLKAKRRNLIRRVGYKHYGDLTTHTQPVSEWAPNIEMVKFYYEVLR